jgi:hypothetical protein
MNCNLRREAKGRPFYGRLFFSLAINEGDCYLTMVNRQAKF